MGTKTIVVVNGLDCLKEIFIKNGDVVSERPDSFLTTYIGRSKGVVSSSGSLWKEHRSFTLSALRGFGFGKRSLESKVIEEVNILVQKIEQKGGKAFNIRTLLTVCISNIMCSINFGQRYDHTDKSFLSLLEAIDETISNTNITFLASIFPFIRLIPGDPFGLRRVLENIDRIHKYFALVAKEHENTYDETDTRDYIDVYLKKMKSDKTRPHSTFDSDQLLITMTDLFFGGTDTTSTVLRWFIVFMINHPEKQEKMRQEIHKIVGRSRFPTLKDKPFLPYTEAVLQEVLRKGCIAPLSLPHGLKEDLIFKGYKIPKDALLVPNIYSVSFDTHVFENPEQFRPERFLDDNGELVNLDKVVTFSLGRRVCLGESLARMEIFLFATTLLQRFQFVPVDSEKLPSEKAIFGISLAPRDFEFHAIAI